MNVEKKFLDIKITSLGEFTAQLRRVTAPKTIERIMDNLPIKGRALKQDTRLILPTDLKVGPEKTKNQFKKGDISIDSSSGNITFHLQNGNTPANENLVGIIREEIEITNMPLSSSVIIRKPSEPPE